MSKVYVSLMTAYDEMGDVNYKQIERLIDYHKELGNHSYFIGPYLFEKWSLSEKEKINSYNLIINKLNKKAKVIIDVSDAVNEPQLRLIDFLNKCGSSIFLSLCIPFANNFSSCEIDHIHHLNKIIDKISKEFYINITYNIVQFNRYRKLLKNIIKNKKVKGLIFNPNFFTEDDIKFIMDFSLSDRKLDIIYNSDEFYFEALKNDNSIISKYINAFPEPYSDINEYYHNGNLAEAREIQEDLNEKIMRLSDYGDLQSIKHILKIKGIDLGGVRKPYYKLSMAEKRKLSQIFFK